jgi:hypothetical protein
MIHKVIAFEATGVREFILGKLRVTFASLPSITPGMTFKPQQGLSSGSHGRCPRETQCAFERNRFARSCSSEWMPSVLLGRIRIVGRRIFWLLMGSEAEKSEYWPGWISRMVASCLLLFQWTEDPAQWRLSWFRTSN